MAFYGITEYNMITLNKGNIIVINNIVIIITGRGHNIMMGTKWHFTVTNASMFTFIFILCSVSVLKSS